MPILVFGALGISDLDGVFEFDLTPTISTPAAALRWVPPRRANGAAERPAVPCTATSRSTPA